jgi:hypothetical protein
MENVRLVLLLVTLTISTISFGCGSSQIDYFPINEGLSREYIKINLNKDIRTRIIDRILATRELQGTKVIPIKLESEDISNSSIMSSKSFYFVFLIKNSKHVVIFATQDEKDIEPKINEPPTILLKFPLNSGSTWKEDDNTDAIIESINEEITVPAGTFKNCIKVKSIFEKFIKIESIYWYAPGVGLIKSHKKYINPSGEEKVSESLIQLVSIKKK